MLLRELLLRYRAIDAGVLSQAEQMSAATGAPLVHVLVRYQVIESKRLARLLSRAVHVELIDVASIEIHPRMLDVVPRHAAERLRVLPIGVRRTAEGERLYLAMADPTDEGVVDIIQRATGRTVEIMCCDDETLGRSFDHHYGVVDEPAVLVGVLDANRVLEAGGEFLTESTAEALRLVETIKTIDLPELTPGGDDELLEAVATTRHPRPVSLALATALAEATADIQRTGQRVMPALQEVWRDASTGSVSLEEIGLPLPDSAALEPDEELFDASTLLSPLVPENELTAPTTRIVVPAGLLARAAKPAGAKPASAKPAPAKPAGAQPAGAKPADAKPADAKPAPAKPAVFLSTPPGLSPTDRGALRDELLELLGPVELDDDAVAACRRAAVVRGHASGAAPARAVVLLGARPQSALLRALLDLEQQHARPRIVILGGDPSLRMLDFVDHHGEMPDVSLGPRAVGVAVMVALRHVGVRL